MITYRSNLSQVVAVFIKADVIVNTVPADLQLGRGSLSQSLLCKAGPMLQTELNATRQETEEKVGSIFMTSGCNLNCKAVLMLWLQNGIMELGLFGR